MSCSNSSLGITTIIAVGKGGVRQECERGDERRSHYDSVKVFHVEFLL